MKTYFTLIILVLVTLTSFGERAGMNQFPMNNKFHHTGNQVRGNAPNMLNSLLRHQPGYTSPGDRMRPDKYLALMQRLDSYEYKEYDATSSQWMNSTLDEFGYDVYGNNISDIYSVWNTETYVYDPDSRQDFTYDAYGNVTVEIYSMWNSTSSLWTNYLRQEYAYNSDGTLSLQSSFYWDENTSQWISVGRTDFTYNSNRSVVLQIYSMWNPILLDWMNSSKVENTYNPDGSISVSTVYTWNMMSSVWDYNGKTEYVYNANGSLASETRYLYDTIYYIWINMSMSEYSYDGYGFMTMEVDYQWNAGTLQWENYEMYEYTFDGNMNMTMSDYSSWDGSTWILTERDEFTYNNAYMFSQLILPQLYYQEINTSQFQHMVTGYTEYYGSPLALSAKGILNYTEVEFNGIAEQSTSRASVYPQPAKDQVTFNWGNTSQSLELRVYDINSRIVLDQQIENKEIVSLANLAAGFYLYKLSGHSGELYQGKLSVR
jgi:hypothetical protein